jgi:hypothetical protein
MVWVLTPACDIRKLCAIGRFAEVVNQNHITEKNTLD